MYMILQKKLSQKKLKKKMSVTEKILRTNNKKNVLKILAMNMRTIWFVSLYGAYDENAIVVKYINHVIQ